MEKSTNNLLIVLMAAAAFIPAPVALAAPDLCDEPVRTVDGATYRDSTGLEISRWCQPHANPPVWDQPVCCVVTDEANCVPSTSRGTCRAGMKFWCEYGEQVGDGVACYDPAPSACESGFCSEVENPNGMTVFSDAIWLCCVDLGADVECVHAGMTEWGDSPEGECGGFLAMCNWGVTNQDGTADCYG